MAAFRRAVVASGLVAVGAAALRRLRPVPALDGEVVVITGGSRGLGLALGREFGRRGCRLAICARDGDRLNEAANLLRREGFEVFAQPCDVGDRAAVEEFLEATEKRLGPIDILVNNAGMIQVGPIESLTTEDFEDARRTMFDGILYTTFWTLPRMFERGGGRIVNITSIAGRLAVPHLLPYVSAKFAAVGFSEGLRAELGGTGVSVTTIVPGLMRTGSHLNGEFAGRVEEEARWFSLSASLPGVSMDAGRAARQIVDAIARREPVRTITLPATVVARLHGVAPGVTVRILTLADRLILPRRTASPTRQRGAMALEEQGRAVHALTALGRSAGKELLQYPTYPVGRPEEVGPATTAGERVTASARL